MANLLVIGYGNELRGDDAVGPRLAAAVAAWELPGVRVQVCHQLTPELAEPIAAARMVVFVDAALAALTPTVQTRRSQPAGSRHFAGHTGDPGWLLKLAQTAFGRCPPAWWVTIPAVDFEFGEPLSQTAERGLAAALDEVGKICASFHYGLLLGTARTLTNLRGWSPIDVLKEYIASEVPVPSKRFRSGCARAMSEVTAVQCCRSGDTSTK
jgi:hydrogenase maturation protease